LSSGELTVSILQAHTRHALTKLRRAGVSGLTSALLLSRNKANSVTVVAKHMPGDYDIEYASPFAGANVIP
jgi:hypothetical protein